MCNNAQFCKNELKFLQKRYTENSQTSRQFLQFGVARADEKKSIPPLRTTDSPENKLTSTVSRLET